MTILRSYTPLVEPLSLDEAFLDVTASTDGGTLAVEIAREILDRIHRETGLTASAGGLLQQATCQAGFRLA